MSDAVLIDGKGQGGRTCGRASLQLSRTWKNGTARFRVLRLSSSAMTPQVRSTSTARTGWRRNAASAHSDTAGPGDTGEAELLDEIDRLNGDDDVDGILVQLPLPGHIDAGRVLDRIDPVKDVDGFHPVNVGRAGNRGRCSGFPARHSGAC